MNTLKNNQKSDPPTESLSQRCSPSSSTPTLISIGMLAHNEAESIARTLRSLLTQTLLQSPSAVVELTVLANGCSDNTAAIAHQILTEATQTGPYPNLSWSVEDIPTPGKPNAWNLFVHQFSSPTAEYLFLMDADIELLGPHTLQAMLDTFTDYPQAQVIVDRPVKDVTIKANKTLSERLSTLLSGLSGGNRKTAGEPAWLCGQLYCASAKALRQIYLPISRLGEDGFLYHLLVTDRLRSPKNPRRVIMAKDAVHSFEAYVQLSQLLKHERWLIVSNTVHDILIDYLHHHGWYGAAASQYINRCNQENPNWLGHLVIEKARTHRWLIPKAILTRRFVSLTKRPLYKAIFLLPIAIAAFFVDLWLSFLANRDLHKGTALKYWGKPTPSPLQAEKQSMAQRPDKTAIGKY